MKKIYSFLFALCGVGSMFAQPVLRDSGTFLLHKFQQAIGQERYVASTTDGVTSYAVDFKYTDRGRPVPLKASMQLNSASEPISFWVKGSTSRFSVIDDSISIRDGSARIRINDSSFTRMVGENSFPIAGYSPATAQMLLLQYWKRHHRPQNINTLPSGMVQIKQDGIDTFALNDHPILLERYVIKGLIWGNELLWTDAKGQLYCLITNDAESDKQEMVLQTYEQLLPSFVEKAAIYGMRLFTNTGTSPLFKHAVIAIRDGNLVDVVNQTTLQHSDVLIENGIITHVGAAGSFAIPPGAFVIDAAGKTILPGLWDMHAHFEQAEWGPAYLAVGVTTVRDCANEFGFINAVQRAIDENRGVGPHILKAGIIDGTGPYSLGIIQAETKEEAIAAVQRYKDNGFVQIKIYSSVKPAIVKAICEEAHHLGLTVTGHIPIGMTLIQGVDSGMDMVNHVQYVYSQLKKNNDGKSIDFSDPANLAVFDFLKTHHVTIDPTLGVYEMSYRSLKDSITNIEPAFASLPEPMKPLFLNTGVSTDKDVARGKIMMEEFKQIVHILSQDSITIVAGTDQGFPGLSLDRELELYVSCGLTPMQALRAATIVPATAMKMEKISGSVETGKKADLIIVNGDPLSNIRNIRNVETVIKDGDLYDPGVLHRLAGFQ
jgi:amidohydrolase family protein